MRARRVDWMPMLAADDAGRDPAGRGRPTPSGGPNALPDLPLGRELAARLAAAPPGSAFAASLSTARPLRENLSGFGSEVLARVAAASTEPATIQPLGQIEPSPGEGYEVPTLVFARGRRRPSTSPPPAPAPGGPDPLLQRFLAGHDDPGAPLAPEHRGAMEPMLGAGLPDVRIHTGPAAAVMARSLQAEAFTIGRNVFFAPGRFEPGTPRGRALLAHELTHVRQQASGGERVQRYGDDTGSAEAEAERIERMVLAAGQQARGGGLAVDTFERYYVASDGSAITPSDRARLDAISLRALAVCERELGPVLARIGDRVLESVELSLSLDLSTGDDARAAEDWGRELARAIRDRLG